MERESIDELADRLKKNMSPEERQRFDDGVQHERRMWENMIKAFESISEELNYNWHFGDGEGGAVWLELCRIVGADERGRI